MEMRYRNGIELSNFVPTLPERHRADPSKNPHKCAKTQRSVVRLFRQVLEQRNDAAMRAIFANRVALQQRLEGARQRLLPFAPPDDLSSERAYVMDRQEQKRNAKHAHEDTVLRWRMEHTQQSLRDRFADRFAALEARNEHLRQLHDAHMEGRPEGQDPFERTLELWERHDETQMRILRAPPDGTGVIKARWKTLAVHHSEFEHDLYRA